MHPVTDHTGLVLRSVMVVVMPTAPLLAHLPPTMVTSSLLAAVLTMLLPAQDPTLHVLFSLFFPSLPAEPRLPQPRPE